MSFLDKFSKTHFFVKYVNMSFLDVALKWVFSFLGALIVYFFIDALAYIFIGEFADKEGVKLVEAFITLVLTGISLYFVKELFSYTVPAAKIGVPESRILGRFKPDSENECGCSVPIAKAKTEGFHLKWPHYKIKIETRETHPLKIEEQRYYTRDGSVFVRAFGTTRTAEDCAYRRAEVSLKDAEDTMNAMTDKAIRDTLLQYTSEEALDLKGLVKKKVIEAFNQPAEVIDENGNTVKRELDGKKVSFASHRFGLELTMFEVKEIRPKDSIAEAMEATLLEKLKGRQNEEQMKRLKHTDDMFKQMYSELSQEKRSQLVKLTEKLATEEKKILGVADLPEIKDLLEKLIPVIIGKNMAGSSDLSEIKEMLEKIIPVLVAIAKGGNSNGRANS